MAESPALTIPAGATVYIDTNIFIYFIEATPGFFAKVRNLFLHIRDAGARIVTSEMTVAECVYKPARDGNQKHLRIYEALLEKSGDVGLIPLTGAVTKRAALIVGKLGLKLIDAIHYLSALEAGCTVFVTSDAAFKSGPNMQVVLVK
jgi:predicted nucleic acid-binding protein